MPGPERGEASQLIGSRSRSRGTFTGGVEALQRRGRRQVGPTQRKCFFLALYTIRGTIMPLLVILQSFYLEGVLCPRLSRTLC